MTELLQTPFTQMHHKHNAKMCPFAGYTMPIQYSEGIIKEHLWVREHVGLFDVSHMGQAILTGEGAVALLEKLTPSAFEKLANGRCKYTVLTNNDGGIIDDLIISRLSENSFFLVLNASRKSIDEAHIRANLPEGTTLTSMPERALLAVQGKKAEKILAEMLSSEVPMALGYMSITELEHHNFKHPLMLSRTGYTGEDGFEVSVHEDDAETLWNMLSDHTEVKPIGLGARDSLRLEMGYPLYGNDIDEHTSPVEAGIRWIIGKERSGFIGEGRILEEKNGQAPRQRVGLALKERGMLRAGTEISVNGVIVGKLTSGGYSPLLEKAIGMAYLPMELAQQDNIDISAVIRGKAVPLERSKLPFVDPKTR